MSSLTTNLHASHGPLIDVLIGPSPQRIAALKAAGITIPVMQKATFLIDTGASGTCVDQSVMQNLGLSPINYISIQTPSTNGSPIQCPVYDVQVIFQPSIHQSKPYQVPHIRAVSVIETHLKSQGIDGLIGRDILEYCLLVYNGHTNSYTLAW